MTDRDARAAKARFIETLSEKISKAKARGGQCLDCGVVDLLEIELWKLRNPPPSGINARTATAIAVIAAAIVTALIKACWR